MKSHRIIAAAATLALAATPVAFAKQGGENHGKGKEKSALKGQNGKGHGKAKAKNVVVKGVVSAVSTDGTTVGIDVTKANKHGAFLRDAVDPLVFSAERVIVNDADGNGATVADLALGDKVLVQLRVVQDAAGPYAARKIIDQTNPPVDEEEEVEELEEAEAAPIVEPTV